ncbi:RagB/SusD family nutrient uptake outer membrane protein [Sphingobacterium sp. N143]|uniref:RagB/SusD family nutrient uptake outer membrane protein n=1 Tax=Sphingobacterium sp. N143 TaxID=2746727 RepID=UPI0025790DE9|nr:RagB/SusD family nutrient uptake outer membrane protein [Sphingobacterium sp. N143]MDM1296217.1 RagB/SusD family nutrient uptake outer membrane protein [Sphingobacterium sp. N143]
MFRIKILAIVFLVGSLSSCNKFLDEKPLAEVALDQHYKNLYDVQAAMAGMYSGFQLEMIGKEQYGEKYLYWGEYRSDNFDRFISYTKDYVDEIVLNSLTPSNQFTDWSGLYTTIGRINNNIKYIPQAAELDSRITKEMMDDYLAQCYALRAMCYFYLVRVWGDAPIWLEPYEDVEQLSERARDPQEKILNEVIIPDLEKAYAMVDMEAKNPLWTISGGSICAIMADVYMWKKDYQNTVKWVERLFLAKTATGTSYGGSDEKNLQDAATWKTIFTNPLSSKETIWSIHWDYLKNGCACMQTSWTANNKQIVVDGGVWSSWFLPQTTDNPSPDIRPKQTLDVYYGMPSNNRDRFIKWYPTDPNPTKSDPWPATNQTLPVYLTMYRLSDIYLLYAEALNGLGDKANAVKYLNFVRKRAQVAVYDVNDPQLATAQQVETAILKERQLELFGEGKRWFDLVRTGRVKEVMDPILKRRQEDAGNLEMPGFLDPKNRVYWPIHRNVLNSNSLLVQNPGYTD